MRPKLEAAKSSLCRGTLRTMPPLLPSLQGDTRQGVILNDPFALAAAPGPQVRPQELTALRKAEPRGLYEARRRCPPRGQRWRGDVGFWQGEHGEREVTFSSWLLCSLFR